MQKKEFIIEDPTGLHARPAAMLVELAGKFDARVTINFDGMEINAKSIISVLSLGLGAGDSFQLIVEGSEEKEAIVELTNFVEKNLRRRRGKLDDIIRQDLKEINSQGGTGG